MFGHVAAIGIPGDAWNVFVSLKRHHGQDNLEKKVHRGLIIPEGESPYASCMAGSMASGRRHDAGE